ncbi:unnamed protein product, partial [Ectocarpus sp. 12 AP-2014]
MSNTKKMTAMSSMEAFFNDLTGASKQEQEEKGEKRDVPHEIPANDSLSLTSTSSSPTFRLSSSRRRSWDRGRMAITSSFRTLASPNLDADVGDVTPRRRPGSRREDGRRVNATPDSGYLPAESGKPAAAAAAEERSAAAGASAAGPRSARSKRLPSPRILPWPSPGPARISGDAPLPSPGSPLPRRRSLSMNSAVSDSSQLSDHQQQWAQTSRSKATAEGPADGIIAAVLPHASRRRSGGGGGSGETGGVSPSSTHRGNVGRLLRRNSERDEDGNCLRKERGATVFDSDNGSGSSSSPRLVLPKRTSLGATGSSGSGFNLGVGTSTTTSNNKNAFSGGRAGTREESASPELVGVTREQRIREGSGASVSSLRSPSTPSGRRASGGPLSRLLPAPTGSIVSEGGDASTGSDNKSVKAEVLAEEQPASTAAAQPGGSGNLAKKKKTLMEKFGDMLEAAAETAIPAAPGGGGVGYGSRAATAGPREWEQWDAAPLLEFMKEEARTAADKARKEEIARTGGDKDKLVALVKAWYTPFLSQAEFVRQKEALTTQHVGMVNDSGRCVSAKSSSLASPVRGRRGGEGGPPSAAIGSSDISPGLFLSRRSRAKNTSPRSAKPGDALRLSPAPEESGLELGGGVLDTASASSAAAGAPAGEGSGGISRAVVIGYVVDRGGGWGKVGSASSRDIHYLVEVEASSAGGGTRSWACYKRFSDFQALWTGLSRRYPRMEALLRFPSRDWTSFLGEEAAGGVGNGRRDQLTTVLDIMLGLTPRPQELVRFLEPHAVGRPPAPVTVALDDARRAAAKSGDLESDGSLVDLSDVFAVPTAPASTAAAGRGARGGRRRAAGGLSVLEGGRRKAKRPDGPMAGREGGSDSPQEASPLPVTPQLRVFLGAVAVLQTGTVLHAAGLTGRALAGSAGAVWVSVGVAGCVCGVVEGGSREDSGGGISRSTVAVAAAVIADLVRVPRADGSAARADALAPTEDTGLLASTKKDGAADGGTVRIVMASEVTAVVVLVVLLVERTVNHYDDNNAFLYAEAFEAEQTGVGLVAGLVAAGARWTAVAAAAGAATVVTVALPPLFAALATAQVAKTFAPARNGSGGIGSGRSSPDPAASFAMDPAAAAAATASVGEDAALRRSSSSSSVNTDAHTAGGDPSSRPGRSPETGTEGATAGPLLGGRRRRDEHRPPVIQLAEVLLRLVVVGGGSLSLMGGCWAGFRPVLAFVVRRLALLVQAFLLHPFLRPGRETVKSNSSSGGGGGGGGGNSSGSSSSSSNTISGRSGDRSKPKSSRSVATEKRVSLTATAGVQTASKPKAPSVPAPIAVPRPNDNVAVQKPILSLVTPVSEPAERAVLMEPTAEERVAATLREKYGAASTAVRTKAAKWRSVVLDKTKRARVYLAKRIMPPGGAAGEDKDVSLGV